MNPFLDKDNEEVIKYFKEEIFQNQRIDFQIIAGDASARRYFRLTSSDEKFQPVILMVSGNEDMEDIRSHIECYNFFKEIGVNIPEIYEAVVDKGYIVEEDVGDLSLHFFMDSGGASKNFYRYYKNAIDQIALLQNSFEHPEIVHSFSHSLPIRRRFTEEKFYEELKKFFEFYFIRYLNMDIPEREDIENVFYELSKELVEIPLVPTHRDYHSRNLFIKTGNLYVLDFQDARLGPPQYDLVSIVYDPYVRLSDNVRKELIEYYKKKVYFSSTPSFFKNFDNYLVLCAIQRLLKAIGTYAYMYVERHNSFYLQFIFNALRDVENFLGGSKRFSVLKEYLKEARAKQNSMRF